MDISRKLLSDVTVYTKYCRYLPELKRRERWEECVRRCRDMHIKRYPHLENTIVEAFEFVERKEVLPSMRSLQFGGVAIERAHNRIYNCAFLPMESWEAFHEIMFLLLGGSGVGFSVQRNHVKKLPSIKKLKKLARPHVVEDSIEGWANAVKTLMRTYFFGLAPIRFDFSNVRPKGSPIVTAGGKAPGPEPLKECLFKIKQVLDRKAPGDVLRPIEVHDIVCTIAAAVLSGGIRRSALISLFSVSDEDMLTAKYGEWYIKHPNRAYANNSAVLLRTRVTEAKFNQVWERIRASGSGEPGVYFTTDQSWGTNPCVEIALRPYQFCNLTTINVSDVTSQEVLNARARAAAIIGTLQAGYTSFHYLRDIWKDTTEADSLIGVSMTGIATGSVLNLDLEKAAMIVKSTNAAVADKLQISHAARTTCVKPEGTTSCVLGCSSGVHAWASKYYIRRFTIDKNEPVYSYLRRAVPHLMEDDVLQPTKRCYLLCPIEAPESAITEEAETAETLLNRVKKVTLDWVRAGHREGLNTHNVSTTIKIKEDEWDVVGKWMWENREHYNGIAVLPFDGTQYNHMPFEPISKEKYEEMLPHIRDLKLVKVREEDDYTTPVQNVACSGGKCEIV